MGSSGRPGWAGVSGVSGADGRVEGSWEGLSVGLSLGSPLPVVPGARKEQESNVLSPTAKVRVWGADFSSLPSVPVAV